MLLGDRIFRDRLEWAVGQPHNLPERYAAGVCSELGLDWQDAKTIADAMRQQIASLPQVSVVLSSVPPLLNLTSLAAYFCAVSRLGWRVQRFEGIFDGSAATGSSIPGTSPAQAPAREGSIPLCQLSSTGLEVNRYVRSVLCAVWPSADKLQLAIVEPCPL